MNCRQTEDMDCLPHAVCYDGVCLMPLIRITMFLFSDGDETRIELDMIGTMTVPQLDY